VFALIRFFLIFFFFNFALPIIRSPFDHTNYGDSTVTTVDCVQYVATPLFTRDVAYRRPFAHPLSKRVRHKPFPACAKPGALKDVPVLCGSTVL